MYGWLDSNTNEQGIEVTATAPEWDFLAMLKNSGMHSNLPSRLIKVNQLSNLPPDPRLMMQHPIPLAIALLVKDNLLEYASLMFAAHHQLPEPQRSHRESQVDRILEQHLGANPKDWPEWTQAMQGLALLVPDALMQSDMGSWLTDMLKSVALGEIKAYQLPEGFSRLMQCLEQCLKEKGALPTAPDSVTCLTAVLASRQQAERGEWMAILPRLNRARPEGVALALDSYQQYMAAQQRAITSWHDINALANVLRSIHPEAPAEEWKERLQLELELAEMTRSAERVQFALSSMRAVSAGIELGTKTKSSQAAMDKFDRFWSGQLAYVDKTALELVQQNAQPKQAPDRNPSDAPLDQHSLQAWSIDQLAAWIEGPLPSQAGPVNRQQVMERARGKRSARQSNTSPASPSPLSPAPTSTGENLSPQTFEWLIRDALADTARYFKGEIADLLAMTQQMAVPDSLKASVKADCERLSLSLQAIEKREPSLDESTSRARLLAAEQGIQRLREQITKAHERGSLDIRFTSALNTALKNESLVLGKKSGGIIACPVALTQWQAICDGFHQRWLPSARYVKFDETPLALQPDQALALYVTGASQSGFAFDVSVHLWRRRPNRNSLPSQASGPFPPMDTNDWFDTYQTCCVLHVPHEKQR